jgi:hypothetical protein
MKHLALCLLLACAAAPAAAQDATATNSEAVQAEDEAKAEGKAGQQGATKKAGDDFDFVKMIEVFDKIFPAQPSPPPERLALARATAAGVLPDGTYAAVFDEMMSGMVDRVLSLSPADFGARKGSEPPTQVSLRQEIAKSDPHFEERMRITRRVIGEELVRLSAVMEPRLRDGLARSIARRFDEAQLREINAFLATDSGRAFGAQTMRMWIDPDVMRSMFQTLPDLMMAMPGAMKRLEAETAHLPKPKKKEKPEPKGEEDAQRDEEEETADES